MAVPDNRYSSYDFATETGTSVTIFKQRKRVMTWLLAVMVIGGSISAPAYQHAHSGGDVAHDHQAENRRQHCDTSGRGHHRHVTYHSATSEAPAAHVHVAMLWIKLTLPTSDGSDSDPLKPTSDEPVAVMLVLDKYVPTADGSGTRNGRTVTKSQFSSSVTILFAPTREYRQPTVASVLLCDTARLERSGVLRC